MTLFTIKPLTWTSVGRRYQRARGINGYSYSVQTTPDGRVTSSVWHGSEVILRGEGGTEEDARHNLQQHHEAQVGKVLVEVVVSPGIHDEVVVETKADWLARLGRIAPIRF